MKFVRIVILFCLGVSTYTLYAGGCDTVCNSTIGKKYFITGVANASGYLWSTTGGITIMSGQGTDTVTLNFSTASVGNTSLCIKPYNDCDSLSTTCFNIFITNNSIYPSAGNDTTVCTSPLSNSVNLLGSIHTGFIYKWTKLSGPSGDNILNSTTYNPTITGLITPGTYKYIYSVSAGDCAGLDTISILVHSSPSLIVGASPPSICYGLTDSIYSNVSGGTTPYIYNWSSGNTTPNFKMPLLTTTNFTLTVTDFNNCSVSSAVNVQVNPFPLANAGSDQSRMNCAGDSAILGSSNTIGYSYSWSPNSGLSSATAFAPSAKPSSTTTYILKVTSIAGCATQDTVVVNVSNSSLSSSAVEEGVKCFGNSSGKLTIHASSGFLPYKYKVSSSGVYQLDSNFYTLSAGNGTYYVEDAKGCISSGSYTISPTDSISISIVKKQDLKCFNTPTGSIEILVSGGAPSYTYAWDRSSSTTNIASNLAGGTYNVTVTDNNLCTKVKTIVISEPSKLAVLDTIVSNACFGDSTAKISLGVSKGTSPYTYLWSHGKTTKNILNLKENTYDLTITDANNCKDVFSYTITAPKRLKIDSIQKTDILCKGLWEGSMRIYANGGKGSLLYSIDSGIRYKYDSIYTTLYYGKYNVAVRDINNCIVREKVELLYKPSIDIYAYPKDTTIKIGESVNIGYEFLRGNSSLVSKVLWSPSEGLSCVDCNSPVATTYANKTYIIKVYTNNNCFVTDTVKIKVDGEREIYIPNSFSPYSHIIENQTFKVYSNNLLKVKMQIFNRWGEKVYETEDGHIYGWDGRYKGEYLPVGVYIYYVEVLYLDQRIVIKQGSLNLLK